MWICLDVIPGKQKAVYLPGSIAHMIAPEVYISFGQKKAAAAVKSKHILESVKDSTFETPLKIVITSKLRSELLIPSSLTYQMKISKDSIIIGPVVGVLLGNNTQLYTPDFMTHFSDHFETAYKTGGLFYAFSPDEIDWDNMDTEGLYYDYIQNVWKDGKFPLPAAIYVRNLNVDRDSIRKLIDISNGNLFNSMYFTKSYLYEYVSKDTDLFEHLPPTELSNNFEQVKSFIDEYKSVILKPVHLSRGRGICIIKKTDEGYNVYDYRTDSQIETALVEDTALENFFIENIDFFDRYIIQSYLSLAKINGCPFDIRVVMQKDITTSWRCTGVECRVAKPGNLLTNISRGGYPLPVDITLKKAFPGFTAYNQFKRDLYGLCHKLCRCLEETGEHFAEFGIDIALDDNMELWILEVNLLPSFSGFKNISYKNYLDIRNNPILYAVRLAGFQNS